MAVWANFVMRFLDKSFCLLSGSQHLLEHMKSSGRFKVVRAEAVVDNEPSWRFLEKRGFIRTEQIPAGHKKNGKTWDRYCYSKEII
jgi:RimJ/RimL family protein N-acetyltransferase